MSKPLALRVVAPVKRVFARLPAAWRPAVTMAAASAAMSVTVGAAYVGGLSARTEDARAHAERIDAAASAGFSEEALSAAAGGLDESALSVARRHDPYAVAGGAMRDRQASLLTARLESLRANGALKRAANRPAAPYQAGADASRELECLTQAVYYEARGEGRAGMEAVAQVVLNRARHPAFPKTVCGVVFQGAARRTGCQFSFTCNGAMRAAVNRSAWNRARAVASKAMDGHVAAAVGRATHFHTTAVAPGWRNSLIRVNQVGDHVFYRFGRAGATYSYAADRRQTVETPRLIQASVAPVGAREEARELETSPVAYTTLVARDAADARDTDAPAKAEATETAAPTT